MLKMNPAMEYDNDADNLNLKPLETNVITVVQLVFSVKKLFIQCTIIYVHTFDIIDNSSTCSLYRFIMLLMNNSPLAVSLTL